MKQRDLLFVDFYTGEYIRIPKELFAFSRISKHNGMHARIRIGDDIQYEVTDNMFSLIKVRRKTEV